MPPAGPHGVDLHQLTWGNTPVHALLSLCLHNSPEKQAGNLLIGPAEGAQSPPSPP
jgi:hypothetical protein